MIHTLERFQTALNGKNFDVVKEAGQPSVSIAVLNKYTSEVMPESNYSLEKSGLENCEYAEDGNGFYLLKFPKAVISRWATTATTAPTPVIGDLSMTS